MAIKNTLEREETIDVKTVVEMTDETTGSKPKRRLTLPWANKPDLSMKIDWIEPSRAFVSAVEFVPFSIVLGVACWGLAFATDKAVTAVLGMLG